MRWNRRSERNWGRLGMKSKWKVVKLGDICNVTMGQSPKSEFYNQVVEGIPFLQGNRTFGMKYPIFDTYTTKVIKLAKKDEILMSVRAPVGALNITKENVCLGRGVCGLRHKNNNQEFLYYLLKYNVDKLIKRESGTVFGSVNKNDIESLEILYLDDEKEQKVIASILSALDEKIALNQQINNNLEQQVQAIFKSWFVDFEPFKDREFIDSEYGKIPKGWQYKHIGELCKSVSVKHKFNKDKLIFLNTGDIENGKFINCNLMSVADMPGQAKKSISKGDILYSEIRPINKHFAYVNFKANDYVVSTKLMVIRAEKIDSRRLYNYLTSNKVIEELQLEAETRSGTFPQIKFDNISRLPILIADNKTETKFIEILHLLYKKIDCNNDEIEKLIKVRDTLLPRLMSGKIKF